MALFDPKAKVISGYQKSIDDRTASIRRYYDEIGKLYYDQYKDMNVDNTKDINTRCEAITKLASEIEDYKLKILFEKGLKKCPNCGTENSLEYGFCFKCGSKFEEESVNSQPEPSAESSEQDEKEKDGSHELAADPAEEASSNEETQDNEDEASSKE